MFAIELAKLPPPKPAVAAIRQKAQYGVSGRCTKKAKSRVGTSSSAALIIVQLRPPNLGTANVYGSRSSDPTRLGSATSTKSCCGVKEKPICSRNAELTLQISQTEKPRCSAKIDQIRLRRATCRPPPSQNSGSSGRQSSTQWPARRVPGVPVAAAGPWCGPASMRVMRELLKDRVLPTLIARRFARPQAVVPKSSNCPHDLTVSRRSCERVSLRPDWVTRHEHSRRGSVAETGQTPSSGLLDASAIGRACTCSIEHVGL